MRIVTLYKSPFDFVGVPTEINHILESIREGRFEHQVQMLRMLVDLDPEQFAKLKERLPAVTFSGVFGERRRREFMKSYSGLIVFDIDKIPNNRIQALFENIKQDKFTFAIWRSPSGRGLKFIVKTDSDPSDHKLYYRAICTFYEKTYTIDIDRSGSDLTRLCYVSHDPDLALNVESCAFTKDLFEFESLAREMAEESLDPIPKMSQSLGLEKGRFNRGKGKNLPEHRELASKIIKYLTLKNLSITNTYERWFRVALAISNSFSYEIGLEYYLKLCRLDGEKHDEDKSTRMLHYAYSNGIENKINFSSIIFQARQEGYDPSYKKFQTRNKSK